MEASILQKSPLDGLAVPHCFFGFFDAFRDFWYNALRRFSMGEFPQLGILAWELGKAGSHPSQKGTLMAGLSDTLRGDIQPRMELFSGRRARRARETLQGYLFILPATIILLLFHFLPVFYAFYISLHKWFIVKGDYVGFANYTRALTTDRFWNSLKVTLWYVVGTVPIQLLLALVIAYLLFQKIRGKEGLRMVYFLPYVTSTVASGAVFAKMFNPTFGPINKALDAIGLPVLRWMKEPRGVFTVLGEMWGLNIPFGGPSVALVTVMFFVIWFWVGYDATIFLAGLGTIPYELYEAAKIDGAGRWQLFRYITIPLLSPTTFFLSLIAVIGSFKAFNHVFMMAAASATAIGGPLRTTTTASILIYNNAFGTPTFGYASAMSFLLFVLILIVSMLQNYIGSKQVHYD